METATMPLMWWLITVVTMGFLWLVTHVLEMAVALLVLLMEQLQLVKVIKRMLLLLDIFNSLPSGPLQLHPPTSHNLAALVLPRQTTAVLKLMESHKMKIAPISLLRWLPTAVTLGFLWLVTTQELAPEMAVELPVLLMEKHQPVKVSKFPVAYDLPYCNILVQV